ncbi:MAG: sugar phosphate isomerase/epimerase [Kiritimatiellae bacterium]|nr:sugar phosphate isomerase/epimerase [Kiritimatiellia bacterium]
MKKGLNFLSFPASFGFRDCCRIARKLGFDGVEPRLAADGEFGVGTPNAELEKLAKEVDIEIHSMACALYGQFPLTSQDEAVRRKGIETAARHIEIAARLGAQSVLIVPGRVKGNGSADASRTPYDKAYETALRSFTEIAELAEKHNVQVGIENVWNMFLLSPLEMRGFIDAIGSRYVGAYFDVGNVVVTGYPEDWIRILGPRIKKIHLKDFKRGVGNINGFCSLGEGDVNWPAVMSALAEAGYDGYCTLEFSPVYQTYSEQLLRNSLSFMRFAMDGQDYEGRRQ